MVCAAKGYPLLITMAESFSVERRKLMRFLGAKVVLTPAALKGTGMVQKARELAEQNGWYWTQQFENEANPGFHSKTTAVEILEAFAGSRLDYWVTGAGTGGTLLGVARVLRKERPDVKIMVCEPDNAQILASDLVQKRNADGTPTEIRVQLADIHEGYEQFMAFQRSEIQLIEALRALRTVHYAAWLARRWHDPAFPSAFPWFGEARFWERHVAELEE
jgi:cysteine synthase